MANAVRAARPIGIDKPAIPTDSYGPFGDEKNSGFDRFNGGWIIDAFTRLHGIATQPKPGEYPF